jgi:hypothetical protein
MTRGSGEILVGAAVEDVFDLVADERNEPSYNPAMSQVVKLTPGPVGAGTRFRTTVVSRGRPLEMAVEYTLFERPRLLGSRTTLSSADIDYRLTFEPDGEGTRMRWAWRLRPYGALRLLGPVLGVLGRRQERRIWTAMKARAEADVDAG